ncbi:putative outer membrane protein PmpA [Trichinella spiralis]|uniref:Outer membrane protein PmpA n=1 Tax=Trichinella spiralis TaxID=6334 RepID=A0ABR3KSG9_TRISP
MITERRKFATTDEKNPLFRLAVERPVVNFNIHVAGNGHPSLLSRSRLNVNALISRLLSRAVRSGGGADPRAVISHFDRLSGSNFSKPASTTVVTTATPDGDCWDNFRQICLAFTTGSLKRFAFPTNHLSAGRVPFHEVVTGNCELRCFLDLSKLNAHIVNLPKKSILTFQYKRLDVLVDNIVELLQKFHSADFGPEFCSTLKNAEATQLMLACEYRSRRIGNDNDDSDGIFGLLKWMVDIVAHRLDVRPRFAQVVEADLGQIVVGNVDGAISAAEFAVGEHNQCPDADFQAQPSEAPDSPVLFADHAAELENSLGGHCPFCSHNEQQLLVPVLHKHALDRSQAQLEVVANSPAAVGDFAFFSDLLSLSPTQYSRSQLSTAEPQSSTQLGCDQTNARSSLRSDPYSPDSTQGQNFGGTFHQSQLLSSQLLADSSTDILDQQKTARHHCTVDIVPRCGRGNFNNDDQLSSSPMKLPKWRNESEMDNTALNDQSEIMNIENFKTTQISTNCCCISSSIGRSENAQQHQQINTPDCCYQRLSLRSTNKTFTSMHSTKLDVIPSCIVGEYRTAPISTRTRRSLRLGLSRRERVLSLHQQYELLNSRRKRELLNEERTRICCLLVLLKMEIYRLVGTYNELCLIIIFNSAVYRSYCHMAPADCNVNRPSFSWQ